MSYNIDCYCSLKNKLAGRKRAGDKKYRKKYLYIYIETLRHTETRLFVANYHFISNI